METTVVPRVTQQVTRDPEKAVNVMSSTYSANWHTSTWLTPQHTLKNMTHGPSASKPETQHLRPRTRTVHFHRKLKQLFFLFLGVNFLMQLQFLAPVELFFKQLKGYSF